MTFKNWRALLSAAVSTAFLSPTLVDAQPAWEVDFFDDFDRFDHRHWQDQMLWVNGEDQCYVAEGQFGTREVSHGTLKLRVVDIEAPRACFNWNKSGEQHPPTRYVAGRIASKNRVEFVGGRWTARLRVENSGQPGMFPAWWLLGAQNNEPPIEQPDETVCWPMIGSGEIDVFEHHSDGGPDHYAARIIANGGACGAGDWQSNMLVQEATLAEYHEYSVEWLDDQLIFRLDGEEVYRIGDQAETFPEPLFAILNFAKINASPMQVKQWTMEVDWVKHERRVD
ncbi:MAG: family 16 glycosylhydrolase [Halieaceae bacterium]|jgi:beta-glucanase (GH16 family)|nr:family 16 glycosylhydrolase [Halieaceae bacterium]